MNSPFNRNFSWYDPYEQAESIRRPFSRSTSYGGVPTHSVQRPKVVQIPVQFVGSEPVDRSASALKIQKVLRGFLVRKSMRRIKDVKRQVDEIEEKLWRSEVVDSIRRIEKERLRINETLMSLLFKLDSIRGFDLGVRDCRKAVIRKAIALQEKIDAIASIDLEKDVGISDDPEPEIEVSVEIDGSDQPDSREKVEHCNVDLDESGEGFEDESGVGGDEGNDEENETIVDVGVDCEVKVSEGNNCDEMCVDSVEEDSLIESDGKNSVGELVEVKEKEVDGNGDDNKRNRELLERMMEDNEKLMSMMTQIFERNEKQMNMLSALTHRVEHLEKAFLFDKLSRKKKMKKMKKEHAAACEEE